MYIFLVEMLRQPFVFYYNCSTVFENILIYFCFLILVVIRKISIVLLHSSWNEDEVYTTDGGGRTLKILQKRNVFCRLLLFTIFCVV